MAANPPPHYSIDTSSLIRWYVEDYSPDVFEGLPDRLIQLIASGRLCAVRSIGDVEIKDANEPGTLAKWYKASTSRKSNPCNSPSKT